MLLLSTSLLLLSMLLLPSLLLSSLQLDEETTNNMHDSVMFDKLVKKTKDMGERGGIEAKTKRELAFISKAGTFVSVTC